MQFPCIAILLAVYDPREDWFRCLLQSLNQQEWPNLILLVRDDASPHVSQDEIQRFLQESITAFPWRFARNRVNMGSTCTFEALTRDALALQERPEYFAYCDQDDIWLPEKISELYHALQNSNAGLICSDLQVIDENGKVTADSITAARPHHILKSGSNLFSSLIYNNFVIGCTTLVRSEAAQTALPFPAAFVHDHWLALCCSRNGSIACVYRPLIQYRIHGGNQTAVLTGISTKEHYYTKKLDPFIARAEYLASVFPCPETQEALDFANARQARREKKPGSIHALKARKKLDSRIVLFENLLPFMPEPVFRMAVSWIRKGVL